MLNMNLQFFAHKKGVGSTKNTDSAEPRFIPASTLDVAVMIHCLH